MILWKTQRFIRYSLRLFVSVLFANVNASLASDPWTLAGELWILPKEQMTLTGELKLLACEVRALTNELRTTLAGELWTLVIELWMLYLGISSAIRPHNDFLVRLAVLSKRFY